MKIIRILALSLGLSLVACGNQANDPAESPVVAENTTDEASTNENNEMTDTTENVESTTIDVNREKEQVSEKADETETSEDNSLKDGSYVATLMAEAAGERNPDYDYATAYNVQANDSSLVVAGSFDYRAEPNNYEAVDQLENSTYEFATNADTVYQAVGGLAEPEIFSPAEFNSFYQDVKDSGLGLIIEVENGIVKTVSVSS